MRSLIKTLAPDRFEDMMALVALYRPGPLNQGMHTEYAERKHARARSRTRTPTWRRSSPPRTASWSTRSRSCRSPCGAAGYSMGQADDSATRHGEEEARADRRGAREVRGGLPRARVIPERLAKELFDLIEPFADYGFPAAHACAYGYVAYQTAYLKAHHPVEFMSAMLTSVKDDKDRKPFYLNACRLMGIEVLPPDVNESENDFAPARERRRRSATGSRPCATWGRAPWPDHRRAPSEGRVRRRSRDFCRKVEPVVLTKRCSRA